MSTLVLSAVVLAALLHALWNALLKTEDDKYAGAMALCLGSLPLAAACLLFAGLPARESWPLVAGSASIHTLYYICLLNAYHAADFTTVYPVSRGSAPVLTAISGAFLLGEVLSPMQALSVGLITCGVMSLVLTARGKGRLSLAGLGWAGLTGVVISAYSLNDGTGARLAGNSFAFYGASSMLNCIVMVALISWLRPGTLSRVMTAGRRSLVVGGPISFIAYALITWAFTQAPIATVSALREVSIVFAMAIGTFILKERVDFGKVASTFVTLSGAVLLRIAR